jgi:nucleoside-triphosphatase THEP1
MGLRMKVAAVIYDMGEAARVDEMLAALAQRLRSDGYALAGAVQHNTDEAGRPCSDMRIEDLSTGRLMDISNPKTTGTGCRLDATALEDVAGIVAGGLDGVVDLVILNRFGKQEIAGNGFRAMMESAVAREIPLLTVLNGVHRPAWDGFASGMAASLPPNAAAIERWCRSVLPAKASAGT